MIRKSSEERASTKYQNQNIEDRVRESKSVRGNKEDDIKTSKEEFQPQQTNREAIYLSFMDTDCNLQHDERKAALLPEDELSLLENEYISLFEDLKNIQKRRTDIHNSQQVLDNRKSDLFSLSNKCESEYNHFSEIFDSLKMRRRSCDSWLDQYSKINVLNDCFLIWHAGHFGIINGFRLAEKITNRDAPPDLDEISDASTTNGYHHSSENSNGMSPSKYINSTRLLSNSSSANGHQNGIQHNRNSSSQNRMNKNSDFFDISQMFHPPTSSFLSQSSHLPDIQHFNHFGKSAHLSPSSAAVHLNNQNNQYKSTPNNINNIHIQNQSGMPTSSSNQSLTAAPQNNARFSSSNQYHSSSLTSKVSKITKSVDANTFGTVTSHSRSKADFFKVPLSEMNAALGACVLLLSILEEDPNNPISFASYAKLIPMGSQSKIHIISESQTWNLYVDDPDSSSIGSFFTSLHQNSSLYGKGAGQHYLSRALNGLLRCLHLASLTVQEIDITCALPHPITLDTCTSDETQNLKIDGLSINYKVNMSPQENELWTRALKYFLTDLKWLVAFTSKHVDC